MKRGEIRWYKFSKPDKKRPVLILTRDSIIEYLGEVTVAPVTTKIRDIPSELFLSKIENSMKNDCAVNCDHIQTVSKGKMNRRRSTLPHSLPCSTIDAKELNFRVRDGYGCGLFAIATGYTGRTWDFRKFQTGIIPWVQICNLLQ